MKLFLFICVGLSAAVGTLLGQSLKIADTILYEIPEGWEYVEAAKSSLPRLGEVTSAVLRNADRGQKLTVSVLRVEAPKPGIQYSTELIEATLSPLVEAYRKKGSHYYPRKILGRGDYIFYSQEVGRLDAPKVELRGVLLKTGHHWVNFFCIGPEEMRWEQYGRLIEHTRVLK